MFQQQMKKYKLEIPQTSFNEYNEPVITYTFDRNVEMSICLDTKVQYMNNDSNMVNLSCIGLTRDRNIKKGDRIDGKYLVEFVEVNRLLSIVHLKEVQNDGRF